MVRLVVAVTGAVVLAVACENPIDPTDYRTGGRDTVIPSCDVDNVWRGDPYDTAVYWCQLACAAIDRGADPNGPEVQRACTELDVLMLLAPGSPRARDVCPDACPGTYR